MDRTGAGRDAAPRARDAEGRRGFGPGRGGTPPRGRVNLPAVIPDPYRYTMADLIEETGLNARTIRYYISQGLLPPAQGRGPTATYGLSHLLRLRMIQLLKAAYRPLEEIKTRLQDLSDDEIAAMLEVETRPPEDRWRRILLHPDVELHVRERAGAGPDLGLDQAIEQIVGLARTVLDRQEGRR